MSWISLLGWASGGVVMSSALPNIISNIRAKGPARPSMLRDGLQLTGNLGWVAYGWLTAAYPVAGMCLLNAAFMSFLIAQQVRRAPPRHVGSQPPAKKELNNEKS